MSAPISAAGTISSRPPPFWPWPSTGLTPVLWLAWVLACRDMEAACDESVLRRSGEDIRRGYSAALLALASSRPVRTPLAFGGERREGPHPGCSALAQEPAPGSGGLCPAGPGPGLRPGRRPGGPARDTPQPDREHPRRRRLPVRGLSHPLGRRGTAALSPSRRCAH